MPDQIIEKNTQEGIQMGSIPQMTNQFNPASPMNANAHHPTGMLRAT
jgi:hypothetical protein